MLTDEEKRRLDELVWKNEARAGRPKEYHAQFQRLANAVPQTCTHDVPGCRVCLIAEVVAAERERCAKIAEDNEDCEASDSSGQWCSAGEAIAKRIRHP